MRTDAALHPYPNGTRPGDVAYVVFEVADLERAMAFYSQLLGWTFRPGTFAQGRQIEGVAPKMGLAGGSSPGGLVVCWRVDDIAAAVERVRLAGGTADEPEVQPHGHNTACVDDQGARFYLWQPTAEQAAAEVGVSDEARPLHGVRPGDISYLTLEVVDADRTRSFFGRVLGWGFHTNNNEDPDATMPMTGIWGGADRGVGVPMFVVDDIAAAVIRVRDAGGIATEPEQQPYGLSADCTDDQGIHFYLGQH